MGTYNVSCDEIVDPFETFLRGIEGNVSAEIIAEAWNKIAEQSEWEDRLRSESGSRGSSIIRAFKRLRCSLRGILAALKGQVWTGHCWDLETGKCIDCGEE